MSDTEGVGGPTEPPPPSPEPFTASMPVIPQAFIDQVRQASQDQGSEFSPLFEGLVTINEDTFKSALLWQIKHVLKNGEVSEIDKTAYMILRKKGIINPI